ncbi:MAG: lysine--tRNA ligase [Zetaproteobacteria bacterium CG1_02_53_45]|nr:MAG: lysine--tRNA ligase [Zetaproteobacteria bacterium CG1_02_53_45]
MSDNISETTGQQQPKAQPSEQILVRRGKLEAMRAQGEAYRNTWRTDHTTADICSRFEAVETEKLEELCHEVAIAGRMLAHRVMGKSSFIKLQDGTGQIQLFVSRDAVGGAEVYNPTKKWDLGDIIGVKGTLFRTNAGELTVKVSHIEMVAKCLRPLPEKWHGLSDVETRYRQRYVDLMVTPESRETFKTRSKVVSLLRQGLEARDFIEVETPMLQTQAGGAAARPFVTHHNALDMDLFLRIAPELYLKRLLVGGFERVFEINRNFRNEGLDATHNPEFTMVEFYQAYADFNDAMDTTEGLIRSIADTLGITTVEWGGVQLDLSRPFKRIRLDEAVFEKRPDVRGHVHDKALLATVCLQVIPDFKPLITWKAGHYLVALFEELVESGLDHPTFITHYPVDVSPLARRNNDEPTVTDRFELFVAGREMANGFSELNDPDDQRGRLVAQALAKAAGDPEAAGVDEDFLRALEFGMPPAAGVGIGVDRLVMMLTGSQTIRDVLLFPHMRPE